ncbi:MAG TPA: biopolymer transporter ExbD [Planctomycetaceae bacterium]|nr:biopolymer transporter ExbD [Planctomycetaceae bacterium]HIQ20083.1 biopolymer transporter ExbD [Planctomycetota bacterium]
MAMDQIREAAGPDEERAGPVLPRRRIEPDVEMDITPMIDIVFLLLIFFIVCATAASQMGVDLPPARYGKGVSEQNAVVFSIESSGDKAPAAVYVGEAMGERLPGDLDLQEERIRDEVERGVTQGKTNVIIKAAREVKHRDVARVASAVGQVEGVRLHVAVLEVE